MEASFTSQIVALFIYDAPFHVAVRIFEMFLLEGEQVVVRLLLRMIEAKK